MTHQPHFPIETRLGVVILSDYGSINGGQAKIAIDSALMLKSRGIDVSFVAGCGPIDRRLTEAGVECRVVGEHDIISAPDRLSASVRGLWNRKAARVVSEAINSRNPRSTVVHIHGWAKALSPSIGPILTSPDVASVYTLHEYFLACPSGGFFDYSSRTVCTRKALGFDCLTTSCDSRSSAYKAWRIARHAMLMSAGRMPRRLREVIYLAPQQRDIMESYFSRDTCWHYLPNPVGPRTERRIPVEDNDYFLFVGRLSPEKGAEVAAAAAKQAGVKIVFCGDGEQAEAVRDANSDAVMTGWVDQSELAQWMAGARALVFPSLWYECYPLVVADALRAGLPVLISDASVARSSVKHLIDGLHVASGDVSAWAAAMQKLKVDDFAKALGLAAFEAGGLLLDEDGYARRLTSIYNDVLARHEACRTGQAEVVRCA